MLKPIQRVHWLLVENDGDWGQFQHALQTGALLFPRSQESWSGLEVGAYRVVALHERPRLAAVVLEREGAGREGQS